MHYSGNLKYYKYKNTKFMKDSEGAHGVTSTLMTRRLNPLCQGPRYLRLQVVPGCSGARTVKSNISSP